VSNMDTVAKRLLPRLLPWLLGAAAFLLVASTASHYGLGWDEPRYFHASDLETRWILGFGEDLLKGQVARSLDDNTIKAAWYWQPYYVPHPPFSRIVSGLTKAIFFPILDKFTAYRLAPALFFGLLVTVMYVWIAEVFSPVAGLFAALSLAVMPNLFGLAHFALTDIPLTTLWFLTVYCFWRGLKSWRWSVLLGIVWGLALATKFPAFLIPIPLLLWAHLYHRQAYANNLFAMIFLSPVVMVISNPYLWHQTLPRIATFLYDSVSRGFRPETNFPIFFFHEYYTTSTLPWYYPFFMIGVTVPEPILFLALAGIISMVWLKPQREIIALFLVNAGFVLVTGLFPGAVLHDVTRLMLPAMPFAVGLASCSFYVLVRYLTEGGWRITAIQRIAGLRAKVIGGLSFLLLFPAALDLFAYHPYELSYYNRLVGGIKGAYERGLEVTYFMEAFTPGFLQYLNGRLPPNATINASFSNFMFRYYQGEGLLRPDLKITDSHDFDYYILLNRRTTFSDADTAFLATKPVIHDAWRFNGVPFVYILEPRRGVAQSAPQSPS